jgi:hypothetical protein
MDNEFRNALILTVGIILFGSILLPVLFGVTLILLRAFGVV